MANSTAERQIVSLKIVHTSDVHGSFHAGLCEQSCRKGKPFPSVCLRAVAAEGLWGQVVADGRWGHIAGESRGVLQ